MTKGPAMKKFFQRFNFVLLLSVLAPPIALGTGNDNPTGVTGEYNGSITTAGSYDPYTGNASALSPT